MKNDRQRLMKQLIHSRKVVTVQELQDQYNVSLETIRRDLRDLEEEGVIVRVYGGATLADHSSLPNYIESWDDRLNQHAEEKEFIAKKMVQYIPDHSTIALDSGTTMLMLARDLKYKQDLTVITNDIHIANLLCSETDHEVFFIGGVMQHKEKITAGYCSRDFLRYFANIDISILNADGFDADEGISDHNIEMSSLKIEMIKRSSMVYALFDSSKFSKKALYHVCTTDRLNLLITDDKVSKEDIRKVMAHNVNLVLVSSEDGEKK